MSAIATSHLTSVPVLIIGGGPVGLALAGDLGWRGISCLLVERSDGSIFQPRMDLVGVRTMEFARRWGIVGNVEASPYPRDYPQDNIYLTAMNGYELGRECFPTMGDSVPPEQSPQKRERCPQDMFDPILREFAQSQKTVEMRYRTRATALRETRDGVLVDLLDMVSGESRQLHARFVVGCDGASSFVRGSLGIEMLGKPALTYTTNIIFRCADFNALHDKEPGYRHILVGPEGTWATIVAINGRDRWRMSLVGDDRQREVSETEIHDAIRRAVGRDFDYEILSVMPWVRRELVAEKFYSGNVFLIGDAVHVMSPTGGFGMNTGIADAVDISWKLAAVIDGWGGDALPATLEDERRPVAQRNVAEASRNLRRMLSPGRNPALLDDTPEGRDVRERVGRNFAQAMSHEWHTLGMHLGHRYDNSPICWPDGTPAPSDDPADYRQVARPGARAPHVWLSSKESTLDLFGRGFVLLRLGGNAPDATPIVDAARTRGMPVQVVTLDEPAVAEAYGRKLVLVRPDGHVCWRDDDIPKDSLLLIDCVRGAKPWAWRENAVDGRTGAAMAETRQ